VVKHAKLLRLLATGRRKLYEVHADGYEITLQHLLCLEANHPTLVGEHHGTGSTHDTEDVVVQRIHHNLVFVVRVLARVQRNK